MKHIRHPKGPLSRIVKQIWTCELPGQSGWELRLPSGATQILVHVGGRPLRRKGGLAESSVVVAGPTTKAFAVDRADQDALVGIVLRPGGLVALGGCPESVVDLALPGFEALTDTEGDLAAIEQQLANSVRKDPPCWLDEAIRLLNAGVGVGEAASLLGQSQRSFRRRFLRQIGLTPKRFARVARMTKALSLLQQNEAGEVAYIAGFADQAHFTSDFRELTGTTPGRYIARDGWPLHLADSHKPPVDGPSSLGNLGGTLSQPALTPRLVVSDAAKAQSFYVEAFGGKAGPCYRDPAGNVVHAEVHLLGTTFSLVDDVWDPTPSGLGGTPVLLHLSCADPDALAASAVAAGGTVLIPIEDRAWGKREGRVVDPFGHAWILSRTNETLSDDELRARGAIS